jgi:trehalose 6-phosphate phosphatase
VSHHLPHAEQILKQATADRHTLLSLDFDGTLITRSETPRQVEFPEELRGILRRCAQRAQTTVIVNSGRAVEELRRLIQLDSIGYAGNHGLEIEVGDLVDTYADTEWRQLLDLCMERLEQLCKAYPDLVVHDKGFTVAVYLGALNIAGREAVTTACRDVISNLPGARITPGAELLNIRPAVPASKGTALTRIADWLADRVAPLPVWSIHMGDDASDEAAFVAAEQQGTAVLVGGLQSVTAGYQLPDPAAVKAWLNTFA